MHGILKRTTECIDRFLFESGSRQTCVLIRICYAALLIIYTLVLLPDCAKWFSDAGVMQAETAQRILDGTQWSIFYWIPASPMLVKICMLILLANAVMMLVGFYSRVQAASVFFWLVQFQNRNPLILDGEDTVFRLFAFFLIFLPLDSHLSLSGFLSRRRHKGVQSGSPWALRLFQVEMSVIYLSAAWSKALGSTWQDGSALYYVYQMGDLFGRFPLPTVLTQSETIIRLTTWSVLLVEAGLPLALWFKPTRYFAIALGIALHLAMEYSMHLFLFQWIMIVGLMSFVDVAQVRKATRAFFSRPRQTAVESGTNL